MKKPALIADIVLAIAVISAAGCGDGTHSVNSVNSTNSPSATATTLTPDLLTTCPVTGDPLGAMGTPYVLAYKGQEVKFCCASCTNDFFKDPDKYMKIIRAADKTPTK